MSARGQRRTTACCAPQPPTASPTANWRSASGDAILRDGYEQAHTCAQIARELPGRTPGAIAARAAKLGIATYARTWTLLDDHRLRKLAGEGLRVESIAQALGRTPQALGLRARRLRITLPAGPVPPRSRQPCTASEDDVLRVNRALNPAVLAEALGRSPHAITQRMTRLGCATAAPRITLRHAADP